MNSLGEASWTKCTLIRNALCPHIFSKFDKFENFFFLQLKLQCCTSSVSVETNLIRLIVVEQQPGQNTHGVENALRPIQFLK